MTDIDWSLLLDRALWLGVGMIIGTAFGYTVRAKREAREALDKVNDLEDEIHRPKDEKGFMRNPIAADIALLAVIILTVWAAWGSARVSSELDQTVQCLEEFNTQVGKALSERDGDAGDTLSAEITLWTKYDRIYKLAKRADNVGDEKKLAKLQDRFYQDVREYSSNLREFRRTRGELPYPQPSELRLCTEE